MTSDKQIAANRENAKKSTGPRSVGGKRKSRRNAFRHGLTAETVIGVLENVKDYEALAATINADYRPATNFELQLIGRLVSLLWRLRRATAIESGLLALKACSAHSNKINCSRNMEVFYRMLDHSATTNHFEVGSNEIEESNNPENQETESFGSVRPNCQLARSFLALADENNAAFDRLSRYETALWRQVLEIVVLLNSVNRNLNLGNNDPSTNYLHHRVSPRISKRILWPPFRMTTP
jgi:hypothetical protein